MTFSPPAPRDRQTRKQGRDGEGRGDVSSLMPSISPSFCTVGISCRVAAGMILASGSNEEKMGNTNSLFLSPSRTNLTGLVVS